MSALKARRLESERDCVHFTPDSAKVDATIRKPQVRCYGNRVVNFANVYIYIYIYNVLCEYK